MPLGALLSRARRHSALDSPPVLYHTAPMSPAPSTVQFQWISTSGQPLDVTAQVKALPEGNPSVWVDSFQTHNTAGRRVFLPPYDIAVLYGEIERRAGIQTPLP